MRHHHRVALICFALALLCYALALAPLVPVLLGVGVLAELAGWVTLFRGERRSRRDTDGD